MKTLFFLVFTAIVLVGIQKGPYDPKFVFSKKMKEVGSGTLSELTLTMAKTFLGTPYEAQTLEGNVTEQLVCRFDALDCTTLVDVSIALAIAKRKALSYNQFLDTMTRLRYTDGNIDGYASRQHYFLSWLSENQKIGLVTDITKSLGGVSYTKEINFMTTHASLYSGIASESELERIKQNEKKINSQAFYFLPKSSVLSLESKLRDGDIIGITSTIEGLDCNHQGIVSIRNNRAYLLHASTIAHQVILSSQPLTDYINAVKRHSGIIVARLNDSF